VVARTKEITRAVVRVEGKAIESVEVEVDTKITKPGEPTGRTTISEEDFFNILRERVNAEDVEFTRRIIEDVQGLGCIIEWKQASFVVKLPDPGGSGQRLSLLIVYRNGHAALSELGDQLLSIGLSEQIAFDYAKELAKLFSDCKVSERYPDRWSRPVSLAEIRQKRNEFMSELQKTVDRIRKASEMG
jgi:hypothetical protein